MKKLTLILLYLVAFVYVATAQTTTDATPEKTPEQRADAQVKKWVKNIALTPEQLSKTKSIFLERYTKEKEIKEKYAVAPNEKAMKEEQKAVRDIELTALKGILTPQQYADLVKIREEEKQAKEAQKAAEEKK